MDAATARAKKQQLLKDLEQGLTFLPGTNVGEATTLTLLHIAALEMMRSAEALDDAELEEQQTLLYVALEREHPELWQMLGYPAMKTPTDPKVTH